MVRKQIIINPAAGVGLTEKQINALKNKLLEASIPFCLQHSKGLDHIYTICQELDETYDEVILAGGDGSVQEAIKGLLNKDLKLSIIPSGTGNDLYRSLYPNLKNWNIDEIIDQIFKNEFQRVNICEANDHIFMNVASMGLDAEIVSNSMVLRKFIHSSKTYLISALYTILFYKPKTYHITIDGQTQTLKAYLIAVGNGRYYGGGMAITPKAQINESILDICIVKSMNRFKLLKLLPTVYSGNHIHFVEVDYFKANTIEIESNALELLNLDGELSRSSILKVNSRHSTLQTR